MTSLVAAATTVIAERGIDALTMRAVASRVGAAPMSLYRHVSDRDELVGLAVDRTFADLRLPSTKRMQDPATWLRAMARTARSRMLEFPGSAEYLLLRGPTGPHTLRFMATVCEVIRRTGRDAAETAWAYDWLLTTIAAYVSKETRLAAGERLNDITGALAERTLRYLADEPELLEVVMSFGGGMGPAYERAVGSVIDALTG